MATRKLSLPLFSAKPPDLDSIPHLHFIAAVRLLTRQYAVVCESQPLMTFGATDTPPVAPPAVPQIQSRRRMRIPLTSGVSS